MRARPRLTIVSDLDGVARPVGSGWDMGAYESMFTTRPTRYEQTDSRITYTGPWATSSSASLSGGSYASGYATATALVKFDGTAIDLIGTKGRWGGIAEVSVDGGAYTLVDFYAPATAHQQVIWSACGLSAGPHTVAISSTVRRNPSSVGGNTYLDAFDVAGTPPAGLDPLPAGRPQGHLGRLLGHQHVHVAVRRLAMPVPVPVPSCS